MADSFVQVPPNSTGLKMQTFENTVSANVVESEAVTLVRSVDNGEVGTASAPLRIDPTGSTAQPVTGTFFPATQPVSATSLPLPTGAATSAKQPALGTAGSASADVITIQGVSSMTAVKVDGSATVQPVSGTFFQTTQPVSAASLPLPTGAATAAKQPALGTAGTPSADVLSIQGESGMTALKVDGSAVTQPVSGTVAVSKTAQTAAAPSATSVGVTSATAVSSNSSRTGLILTNTSSAWISLGMAANAAVLFSGISLAPNGGTFVMDGFTFSTGAITAIAASAASNLAIQELS